MQTRPIHSINQRGELRRRQPHHAVRDRRPPECTLLQPLPIQHQAQAKTDRFRASRSPGRQAHRHLCGNRSAASPPAPAFPPEPQSCGRLHGAQHISEPAKVNAGFSMYHRPAISIAIDPARCLTAPAAPGAPVAVTTGTNIGGSAAGRTRRPVRAALRHPNRCCGVMSCRRAGGRTSSPHWRRRPTPVRISMRPRRSEASTIWSTIYANRSNQDGLHLPDRIERCKMGTEPAYALDLAFSVEQIVA